MKYRFKDESWYDQSSWIRQTIREIRSWRSISRRTRTWLDSKEQDRQTSGSTNFLRHGHGTSSSQWREINVSFSIFPRYRVHLIKWRHVHIVVNLNDLKSKIRTRSILSANQWNLLCHYYNILEKYIKRNLSINILWINRRNLILKNF